MDFDRPDDGCIPTERSEVFLSYYIHDIVDQRVESLRCEVSSLKQRFAELERNLSLCKTQKQVHKVTCSTIDRVNEELGSESTISSSVSCGLNEGDGDKASPATLLQAPEAIRRLRKAVSKHRVEKSVWEAIAFVGLPGVGTAGSCLVILNIILNFTLQLLFAVIAWDFDHDQLPDVDKAREWRLHHAHSITTMNQASWVSLADSVCGDDDSLTLSSMQLDVLEEIRRYLAPAPIFGELFGDVSVGLVLCVIAIFAWLLSVAEEIQRASDNVGFLDASEGKSDSP